MPTFRYRIFHDEEQSTKRELTRPALNSEQLRHEYDNIDTALHLYCRGRGLEVPYEVGDPQPDGVVISFDSFATAAEADTFVQQFTDSLQEKVPTRFCPGAQRL
jgi:hypothetical protein